MRLRIAVLTGAGISAESGIPTFRGAGGLWERYKPEELASPEAFRRDPKLVWEWYDYRRLKIKEAEPNRGHRLLASMEEEFPNFTLITQNVDGLHQRAGSKRVIELHGNIWKLRCTRCTYEDFNYEAPLKVLPPACPSCGGLLRPGVVWFGESLPIDALEEAYRAAKASDVFLVVGTSGMVYPAAQLPIEAKERGAYLIEVNPEETPLSPYMDTCIREKASVGVEKALELIRSRLQRA